MRRVIIFALVACIGLAFAKPMESLENYNVILVHGAAPFHKGIDNCENEPYAYDKYGSTIGNGAAGMVGPYRYNDGDEFKYNLTYFLDSAIFENIKIKENGNIEYLSVDTSHFSSIYIQRPFVDPAESPLHNAEEIGNSKWKCGNRRSLIEEAQEVRAKGQDSLKNLRNNHLYDKLPPSRNILIAHSMGGVASREYVQGDFYNDDVDKVITLDSPHEGTGARNFYIPT